MEFFRMLVNVLAVVYVTIAGALTVISLNLIMLDIASP